MTSIDQERKAELQRRRQALGKAREDARHRESFGPTLVDNLSPVIGAHHTVDDFQTDIPPPFKIRWPKGEEKADGLYAAWIGIERARAIAGCIASRLENPRGLIGIYGCEFLGLIALDAVSVPCLVDAAERTNDTVTFYPGGFAGVIVFDCYKTPYSPPFNVLVQGKELVEKLAQCF